MATNQLPESSAQIDNSLEKSQPSGEKASGLKTSFSTFTHLFKRFFVKRVVHNPFLERQLSNEFSQAIEFPDETKMVILLSKGYQPNMEQHFSMVLKETVFSTDEMKRQIKKSLHALPYRMFDVFQQKLGEIDYDPSIQIFSFKEAMAKTLGNFTIVATKVVNEVGMDNILQDDKQIYALWQAAQKTLNVSKEYGYSHKCHLEPLLAKIIKKIGEDKKHVLEQRTHTEVAKYNVLFNSFDGVKSHIVTDVVDNIARFSEKDLPKACQQLIKQLRNIYEEASSSQLDTMQAHELENLYHKTLPKILEEYITISPRYKERLKKANDDPDALLLESLKGIHEKLQQIADMHQENNHHQLKVSHRYVKKL